MHVEVIKRTDLGLLPRPGIKLPPTLIFDYPSVAAAEMQRASDEPLKVEGQGSKSEKRGQVMLLGCYESTLEPDCAGNHGVRHGPKQDDCRLSCPGVRALHCFGNLNIILELAMPSFRWHSQHRIPKFLERMSWAARVLKSHPVFTRSLPCLPNSVENGGSVGALLKQSSLLLGPMRARHSIPEGTQDLLRCF